MAFFISQTRYTRTLFLLWMFCGQRDFPTSLTEGFFKECFKLSLWRFCDGYGYFSNVKTPLMCTKWHTLHLSVLHEPNYLLTELGIHVYNKFSKRFPVSYNAYSTAVTCRQELFLYIVPSLLGLAFVYKLIFSFNLVIFSGLSISNMYRYFYFTLSELSSSMLWSGLVEPQSWLLLCFTTCTSLISIGVQFSVCWREIRTKIYVVNICFSLHTLTLKFICTNGQKKGYTEYMSKYSLFNLKHSIFLIKFERLVYKDVIYSQNSTKRQWHRPNVKHVECVYKLTCEQRMNNYFV